MVKTRSVGQEGKASQFPHIPRKFPVLYNRLADVLVQFLFCVRKLQAEHFAFVKEICLKLILGFDMRGILDESVPWSIMCCHT